MVQWRGRNAAYVDRCSRLAMDVQLKRCEDLVLIFKKNKDLKFMGFPLHLFNFATLQFLEA